MRDAFKQKAVGLLLVLGAVFIVCGLGSSWVFSVAGVYRGTYTREPGTNKIVDGGALNLVPVAFTVVAVGVVFALLGLGYGWFTIATQTKGIAKTHDNVKILARYAINKSGDMLCEWYQIEEAYEDVRFYVRLILPSRDTIECECSEQVFHACGEGMYGRAVIQNRWLGQFIGYVGGAAAPSTPQMHP